MSASSLPAVQPARIRILKQCTNPNPVNGPVVYWMFRDQRLRDNWALIHAVHQANKLDVPVAIAFNLFHQFKGAKARQLGFMLRGLKELYSDLQSTLHIPFFLFQGESVDTIPSFLKESGASLLVTDFSPLREVRQWKDDICRNVNESVSIHEVDAHNVVPVWEASDKLEYGARTIRSKINKKLPEYLIDFPELVPPNRKWDSSSNYIDWDKIIADVVRVGAQVPEIEWCVPGENAALEVLKGNENGFLTARLKTYASDRNNPLKPKALSGLSPYLHFGQLSAQRCALEARNFRKLHPQAVDVFLEELIVRRELADNFCFYQPHYDSLQGAWEWARKTLIDHASDKREHIYTKEQLEMAQTADPLWNASQLELVYHGKMHGFMSSTPICDAEKGILKFLEAYDLNLTTGTTKKRQITLCAVVNKNSIKKMYWAKKILEWTSAPEEALAISIYLNDKYHIDGRDPSGYVGCMWSICGIHDQGWRERPVFGKVRYMNYAGCKRKFDVDGYIAYVKKIVGEIKKRKAQELLNNKAKRLKC